MARVICFVPDRNSPGKNDMTGAFLPEAIAYARFKGAEPREVVHTFPALGTLPVRRAKVVEQLSALTEPVETIAFFCHGYFSGLQCGFTLANVITLARLIAKHATPSAVIALYACNAGGADGESFEDLTNEGPGGDGGFADALRDACDLMGRRVVVAAHANSGHCTWNPRVRRFAPGSSVGGEWYVKPGSPEWPRWVAALRSRDSMLKFRFPDMTPAQVRAELAAPPRVG